MLDFRSGLINNWGIDFNSANFSSLISRPQDQSHLSPLTFHYMYLHFFPCDFQYPCAPLIESVVKDAGLQTLEGTFERISLNAEKTE